MTALTDLAVLVPVLARPQNVAPLVESFLACPLPSDARLVFYANEDDLDEIAELRRVCGVDGQWPGTLTNEIRTWPQKINYGVADPLMADVDWFLCAADDVTFTPGWWEATADLRADPRIGVIGTNDSADGSGNPAVAAGEHTCHPLIRASYIRDYGTWDEKGVAVHSGYAHWFVDNELVVTAKMRRAWAYCKEAVIQHNHPYWGRGQWDATYALGEANAEADKQLWFERSAKFGPLQPYPVDDPRCTR